MITNGSERSVDVGSLRRRMPRNATCWDLGLRRLNLHLWELLVAVIVAVVVGERVRVAFGLVRCFFS